jgi:hypothetical protein
MDRDLNAYVETIPESELGVWPTSSHTLDGIFILKGNSINQARVVGGVNIIDLAPTILYLMGFPIPENMDGSVIQEAIDAGFLKQHPIEKISSLSSDENFDDPISGYSKDEETKIRDRLKDLGYIE